MRLKKDLENINYDVDCDCCPFDDAGSCPDSCPSIADLFRSIDSTNWKDNFKENYCEPE